MKTRLLNLFGITITILILLHASLSYAQPGFWGMTSEGGADEVGTIFKSAPDGTGLAVKYSFNVVNAGARPYVNAQLLKLSNGKLYGVTSDGGNNNAGVLFEYDPSTGLYTKKVDFSNTTGRLPMGTLTLASNGKLYGMASAGGANNLGTIYEYDVASNALTKKIDLTQANGHSPNGNSLYFHTNGKLYGLALFGGAFNLGVLFEYDPNTNTYTKKIDFSGMANGASPYGSLMISTGGRIFGMTLQGGTNNKGTLFEYAPGTNTLTKRFDFTTASGSQPYGTLVEGDNNRLYGVTSSDASSLFEFNPANNTFTKNFDFNTTSDGIAPIGTPAKGANGKLYGATLIGGSLGGGVLYEYDITTNTYTKKHDFSSETGSFVYGSLTLANNGNFYGLTYQGGIASGQGVLFEYNPNTSSYSKKIEFEQTPNGKLPFGGLALASNKKLYGMTQQGGSKNGGVLFELDPLTNVLNPKHEFDGTTGSFPQGNLTPAPDGKLYGMTSQGGSVTADGVIFEFDPSTGTYTVRYEFDDTNGSEPIGSLMLASNGKLYGMTGQGGITGYGVLFEFDPATNFFTKKTEFDNQAVGFNPYDALIEVSNGKFYGTCRDGGLNGNGSGTIFEYDLATNTITKKVNFSGPNGENPEGSLVKAPNGKLYGVTRYGGANSSGVLFEYDVATGTFTKKFDFGTTSQGPSQPTTTLALSPNGKLYGSTLFGGTNNRGVLFEYDPVLNTLIKKQDFTGANGAGLLFGRLLFLKGEQTITFNALTNKLVNDAPFTITATSSASLPITFTSSNTSVATVSGSTITIVGAGTTTITASQAGDASYNAATNVERSLTVNKLDQTITFGALATKNFGDADFTIAATTNSGLAITYTSSNTAVATIVDNTVTIVGAGTTTITASQEGNGTYNAAAVTQNLTVNKIDQTITFGALAAKNFGDANFTLSATTTSGLAITYTSSNTDVATIAGNTVTIVGAGTTNITASQAGNDNYNAASDVVESLTVNKTNQTITFTSITDKTVGDAAFTLSATSTSSLPISFSSTSTKVTINNAQVTIISAGRVTITAAQAGNANYNEATSVDKSFCIKPAKPSITVSNLNTTSPTLTSSAASGNQWYRNGVAISGATAASYSATQAGIYKVQVQVDDCVSEFSNDQALVVTGDLNYDQNNTIEMYPNPATNILNIKLGRANERKEVGLYDLTGREMEQRQVWDDLIQFDVSGWVKGVYLLKVKDASSEKVYRLVKE